MEHSADEPRHRPPTVNKPAHLSSRCRRRFSTRTSFASWPMILNARRAGPIVVHACSSLAILEVPAFLRHSTHVSISTLALCRANRGRTAFLKRRLWCVISLHDPNVAFNRQFCTASCHWDHARSIGRVRTNLLSHWYPIFSGLVCRLRKHDALKVRNALDSLSQGVRNGNTRIRGIFVTLSEF